MIRQWCSFIANQEDILVYWIEVSQISQQQSLKTNLSQASVEFERGEAATLEQFSSRGWFMFKESRISVNVKDWLAKQQQLA